MRLVKGTVCRFREEEINKPFSEENISPEHCLELGRWQGPPHINKVKQYETVLSLKVSLFIKSWKWILYVVCLDIQNISPEDFSLLINISAQNIHSVPSSREQMRSYMIKRCTCSHADKLSNKFPPKNVAFSGICQKTCSSQSKKGFKKSKKTKVFIFQRLFFTKGWWIFCK